MSKNFFFSVLLLFLVKSILSAQSVEKNSGLGLYYGIGVDKKTSNYKYTTRYFKFEYSHLLKQNKKTRYEFLIQPKIEFKKYQGTNYYYSPSSADPENLNEYNSVENITDYSLSFGILMNKPLTKRLAIFISASVGPMITDTYTERLSKGFAFTNVLALGLSLKTRNLLLEVRPNLNHISNAGLQKRNIGYNTLNMEFGVKVPMKSKF